VTHALPIDRTVAHSPVNDVTYDLMQALTSKLEAIEAYELYREDADGTVRQLFDDLLEEDRRQAERLLDALRNVLTGGAPLSQ
jgi:hypothetical protein